MKRLKNKLLSMEPNTATYSEMYNGILIVSDPKRPWELPETRYDPTYYNGDIGFMITVTHKLAQDKPTVTVMIPCELLGISEYNDIAADFCLREFEKYVQELNAELYNRSRPDNENGKYYISKIGGEVIKRNSSYFEICTQKDYENGAGSSAYLLNDDISLSPRMCICIKLQVQLPKKKLRKAVQMLCRDLPNATDRFIAEFDLVKLLKSLEIAEKQKNIREWLKTSNYCAFIANGSILPRAKNTDLPMPDAIPFISTPNDEIEIFGLRGMGIKKGVTVITGGGYSGKSTLLDAISVGIYDHSPGDGRELCITDRSAVTICAEDGRSVKHVNISPFIKWLSNGDTSDFSTEHASGSTSQAANIMEAIDSEAKLLLIDEDRSATNFMIRDGMMKELIEKEPITPFTDRVKELYDTLGVSTILVIGGSGEYLSVADKIYMMQDYTIHDVTERSKSICSVYGVSIKPPEPASWKQERTLYSQGFTSYPEGSGSERLSVSDTGFIIIGDEKIDVRGLYNIISPRQLDTLGFMLRYIEISNSDRKIDIKREVNELYARIEKEGIDFLYSSYFTTCERFLDLPRKQELLALINRMRKINYLKQ